MNHLPMTTKIRNLSGRQQKHKSSDIDSDGAMLSSRPIRLAALSSTKSMDIQNNFISAKETSQDNQYELNRHKKTMKSSYTEAVPDKNPAKTE